MTPKQFRLFMEMLEAIRLTIQRGDMTSYNCGPLSKADEMSYQVLEEASKMEEEAENA